MHYNFSPAAHRNLNPDWSQIYFTREILFGLVVYDNSSQSRINRVISSDLSQFLVNVW